METAGRTMLCDEMLAFFMRNTVLRALIVEVFKPRHAVVVNAHQRKGMPWHGVASRTAVFASYDVVEFCECDFSTPHIDQGAHNGAHHVAQKAVGGNFKAPQARLNLLPMGTGDVADVRFGIGVQLAETGKVAHRKQMFSSLVHEVEAQREGDASSIVPKEGVLVRIDPVMVRAAGGRETRMCLSWHGYDALHGNVGGEQTIEFVGKLVAIDALD